MQDNVASQIGQKLSSSQRPVSLDVGLYTTCRGDRVLVFIRFNATILPLRPYCAQFVPLYKRCRKSNNVWLRALMLSGCSYSFYYSIWTLQPRFTLRLSVRTLQCLRACTCHSTFVLYLALTRVGLNVLLWM